MRIAINALAVDARRPCGDATYVRELVRHIPAMAPADDFVVYVQKAARPLFTSQHRNLRYVVCPLPGRSNVARAVWEQLVMPRLLATVRVDLLHAPVNVAPVASSIRYVLTLHEAEPFVPASGIPVPLAAWWRFMRQASARKAAAILTVSNAARRDIEYRMKLNAGSIHVIHLGVDRKRFSPFSSTKSAVRGQPYVLWVGRPYPSKNLAVLVDAFADLHRRGHTEWLVLAGPRGWNDRDLNRMIGERGCSQFIRRVPPISNALADWYRAARLVVIPSLRESFGLPMIEAMACGTPVVASDIPAFREIGRGAFACADPKSSASVADQLSRTLTDEPFRSRLRTAGSLAAARFDWSQTAAQTLKIYVRAAAIGDSDGA